jgi:hypothetical protein
LRIYIFRNPHDLPHRPDRLKPRAHDHADSRGGFWSLQQQIEDLSATHRTTAPAEAFLRVSRSDSGGEEKASANKKGGPQAAL